MIAKAHYDNFEIGKSELSVMTMTKSADSSELRIPEKFNQVIMRTIMETIPKDYNKAENNLQDETDQNALLLRNTLINNLFLGVDI